MQPELNAKTVVDELTREYFEGTQT